MIPTKDALTSDTFLPEKKTKWFCDFAKFYLEFQELRLFENAPTFENNGSFTVIQGANVDQGSQGVVGFVEMSVAKWQWEWTGQKSTTQIMVFQLASLYPLSKKRVEIFSSLTIFGSLTNELKKNFVIAFTAKFWWFFKQAYLLGDPVVVTNEMFATVIDRKFVVC